MKGVRQCLIIVAFYLCLYIVFHNDRKPAEDISQYETLTAEVHRLVVLNSGAGQHSNRDEYFVLSAQCEIPKVQPFTAEILKIYKPQKYQKCTNEPAIVTSTYNATLNRYVLHIAEHYLNVMQEIFCCYKEIVRSTDANNRDSTYRLVPCLEFEQDYIVPLHIAYGIIVKCYQQRRHQPILIQNLAFSFVQKGVSAKETVAERKQPSVLMIGIDSLSRINMRRVMPKTFDYLTHNNWYEMQGYNKIEDNTFPNLMAVLTGYNLTSIEKICNPRIKHGLDNCPFVWKDYSRAGYLTAYAEDLQALSTFNYKKKGFQIPPVDYYLRPFMLAVESELKAKYRWGLSYCQGLRHTAEYVLDYCLQFARRFVNSDKSIFGLFWTNSFSHNSFDAASTMDDRMITYFEEFAQAGVLNESIIIFFSDHGVRWGPLLQLDNNYLEERLPMLFIWLPLWFRQQYPEETSALIGNQQRLSSPYDLHMTLKHLLTLKQGKNVIYTAPDCPQCQSLLRPLDENRSCAVAAIADHWCTCVPYKRYKPNSALAVNITQLIIDKMNSYLVKKRIHTVCANFTLSKLLMVERKIDFINSQLSQMQMASPLKQTYRMKFHTNPKESVYQATAVYDIVTNTVDIDVETISKLNSYVTESYCLQDQIQKKYCICKK